MHAHPSDKLPDAKRARLFQVARGEFAARGFSQASLNRIISQVGMSKSSFYHYFANKSDLFRQSFLDALAPILRLADSLEIDAGRAADVWPAITRMAMQVMPIVHASPEIVMAGRMFYRSREDAAGTAVTEPFLTGFSGWLSRQLAAGQALGAFRRDLPESLLIDLLMAMGMSMDRWMLAHWEQMDEARRLHLTDAGFDLLRRLLAPG